MLKTEDDAKPSGRSMPLKDYIISGNNVYERVNKRPEDVMKAIHYEDEEVETPVGNNAEKAPLGNSHERNEERFHFVHPEIEDVEAWRIHDAVKRLVTYQKIPEICAYFKELKIKDKVLLPANASIMYGELRRMGMPSGEGFSEKHFSNSYMK